jgi:type I restriction enzyme M protein
LPAVITGALKSEVDRVWDAFWSGGISNPLEVIEQITYLLFLRRLDDLQTLKEHKAQGTGEPLENPIFLREDEHLRWSRFKNDDPDDMYKVVSEEVFPFLRNLGRALGGDSSTYSDHMKDARFTIPTSALLAKVVDMLSDIPMEDRDTKGDLYEYLLSKIANAGTNGQFRTPRHIIRPPGEVWVHCRSGYRASIAASILAAAAVVSWWSTTTSTGRPRPGRPSVLLLSTFS